MLVALVVIHFQVPLSFARALLSNANATSTAPLSTTLTLTHSTQIHDIPHTPPINPPHAPPSVLPHRNLLHVPNRLHQNNRAFVAQFQPVDRLLDVFFIALIGIAIRGATDATTSRITEVAAESLSCADVDFGFVEDVVDSGLDVHGHATVGPGVVWGCRRGEEGHATLGPVLSWGGGRGATAGLVAVGFEGVEDHGEAVAEVLGHGGGGECDDKGFGCMLLLLLIPLEVVESGCAWCVLN